MIKGFNRVVIALIAIAVFIIIATMWLSWGNHYSLDATVINKENTFVLFEDTTGNLWEFNDIENIYSLGDNVRITWNDKGTDFKTDDEIEKIEMK